MSVFGGDSWGREAQYRKRRVEELIADGIASSSSYKKLSSGKYACLVCPHTPVLDTHLMLSIHIKGSRHCAAASKLKERELVRENEINKRMALSQNPHAASSTDTSTQKSILATKPIIEQTWKAVSEMHRSKTDQQSTTYESRDVKFCMDHITNGPSTNYKDSFVGLESAGGEVLQQQLDYRERRERELKFTAAGWKRDCHGGWFRDENVEFDSDEEDPNIYLAAP